MVSIAAFQAVDPGSIPGRRNSFLLPNSFFKTTKYVCDETKTIIFHLIHAHNNFLVVYILMRIVHTYIFNLDSGIQVGPTFINFGFFSKPYCLIKEGKSTIF
jgi:hypothetical protein